MINNNFYDGILYQVEYKRELSNSDYTQHKVYHIKTDDEVYTHAHKAITSIMKVEENNIWSAGVYQMKNKQQPSMANAFHKYYTFSYNEDLDVYVFTIVIPYDD